MFEATTKIFVNTVGLDTLLPPPSLEEAIDCKPLALITKERPLFGWKAVYVPSPYSLEHITRCTDDGHRSSIKLQTDQLGEVKTSSTYKVTGKIGSKFSKFFNLRVQGSSSINLEADFGKVNRYSVEIPTLVDFLAKAKLKESHHFAKKVINDKRRKFYIIVGTVYSMDDITIQAISRNKLNEEFEVEAVKMIPSVEIGEKVSLNYSVYSKFVIPKERTLAFKMIKVEINDDGSFKIIGRHRRLLSRGAHFRPLMTDDIPDIIGEVDKLFLTDKKYRLFNFYQGVISAPCCIDGFLEVIKNLLEARQDVSKQDQSCINIEDKLKDLPVDWKQLLSPLGITGSSDCITNTTTTREGIYVHSLLQSACHLLRPLSDLSDDQCMALAKCKSDIFNEILDLLKKVKEGDIHPESEGDIIPRHLQATLTGLLDLRKNPRTPMKAKQQAKDHSDSARYDESDVQVELTSRLVNEAELISFILNNLKQLTLSGDDIDGGQSNTVNSD
ncbi:uncharacterized protein LOC144451647 [Glandiceps talaboti]